MPRILRTTAPSVLLGMWSLLLVTIIACATAATPHVVERQVVVTPTSGPKQTITFSDLNWTSAKLQTRIAMFIVKHGYGYPVETISGDTIALFTSLLNRNTQVTMEVWLPNQREAWDDALAKGRVIPVGRSLDDSWQSAFVVPRYLLDENPGLRSVQDLRKFKELFVTPDSNGKARLITCVSGWACHAINQKKIAAYGLNDVVQTVTPESAEALFASLKSSYAKKDPWLGYVWGPTKVANELDLAVLEETDCAPKQKPEEGCAYPTSRVLIAVHPSLIARAPEVVEFLRQWDFTANSQISAEDWMAENDAEVDAAAVWFLKNNRVWTKWVPNNVAEKVQGALAGQK